MEFEGEGHVGVEGDLALEGRYVEEVAELVLVALGGLAEGAEETPRQLAQL